MSEKNPDTTPKETSQEISDEQLDQVSGGFGGSTHEDMPSMPLSGIEAHLGMNIDGAVDPATGGRTIVFTDPGHH